MGNADKSREATRRTLLKATGIAGLGAIVLPSSWTKPVLKSVVVPAHAQTTPAADEKAKPKPKAETTAPPEPTTTNTTTETTTNTTTETTTNTTTATTTSPQNEE